jgi:cold-inducible RNA-binding protein
MVHHIDSAANDSAASACLFCPRLLSGLTSSPAKVSCSKQKEEFPMTNIFVGNLSYQTSQDELEAAFAAYGAVERVSVVTDRDSGQPRGFAFVEMTNKNEANNAISALNGTELNGRALNVNEARPREDRGGRSGGNSGGYGRQRREPRW